jgi:hypothetical protein
VRVIIPAHPMITQTNSITVRTALSVAPPRHSPSVIPPIRTTNDATHPKDPQTERRLTHAMLARGGLRPDLPGRIA